MKRTLLTIFASICFLGLSKAQDAEITFNVNMSYQITQGNFDPVNDFVDVAGDFNDWGASLTQLSDADEDSIYSITIDGFTVGQTIQFKFRINGNWDDLAEFPQGGPNRVFQISEANSTIDLWYNDEILITGPPEADFRPSTTFIFEGGLIYFENESIGSITGYEWYFEGGLPETSTDENPAVRYPQSGAFDVQLIAYNDEEADTLLLENHISISERLFAQTQWWNDRVFYEIFVRSFYDSDGDGIGDFQGIIEKMDYLNDGDPETDTDLGITGIWLMPIHPSPSYHGYDVTNYTEINPDYGTMDDFREFMALAHERGIAVIIDFVMNHTSNQHPWFQASRTNDPQFRNFYRWSPTRGGLGPWGQNVWHTSNNEYYYGLFFSGMPDINYNHQAAKDSMFRAADFWINEIGVDGFRQDAVLYIHEEGDNLKNTQQTFDFWAEFNAHVKASNPNFFNVAEAWEPTFTALQYVTNARLDYAFEFDLSFGMIGAVMGEDASSLIGQMEFIYNVYPYQQFGTFLTNHDMNRLASTLIGNISPDDPDFEFLNDLSIKRNKLLAAMYLTLPGIPYIYYGEEIGQFGVKPDEDIRRPLQWNDSISAGFSTDPSPWRAPYSDFPTKNIEAQQANPNSLWSVYRDIIKLRNDYPMLRTGDYEVGISNDSQIFAFMRGDGTDSETPVIVILNLGSEDKELVTIEFSDRLFNYNSRIGGCDVLQTYGEGLNFPSGPLFCEGSSIQLLVDLEAQSINILEAASGGLTTDDETGLPTVFELEQNFPNPFNPSTNISFSLPQADNVRLQVYDITGRLVQTLVDERRAAGSHQIQFNASALSSGVYIYRLETGSQSLTRKMTLIK